MNQLFGGKPLAIIDVETTGGNYFSDRIIEIGILRIENGQIQTTYNQLINPNRHLPPQITHITGIEATELQQAPLFHQIIDDIQPLLTDAIFVAHNATFDYGFIKAEFKRTGRLFQEKRLCSVRLSRLLFPEYRRHSLDSLIDRFAIRVEQRHRALDDAKVIWDFFQKIITGLPQEQIDKAIKNLLKSPALPPRLKQFDLPEHPGVYIFYDQDGAPLYIGKSIDIKSRVHQHFQNTTLSTRSRNIIDQTADIEVIKTGGNLSAQLLESKLIKQLQPIYNRQLRYSQSLTSYHQTEDSAGYLTLKPNQVPYLTGTVPTHNPILFRSQNTAKQILTNLAQEHQLCLKLLGLEKPGKDKPCFAYHLGDCPGACIGTENPLKYNIRFLKAITPLKIKSWPFPGTISIKQTHFDITEYLIIDHWQHLTTLDQEGQPKDILSRIQYPNGYNTQQTTSLGYRTHSGTVPNQTNIYDLTSFNLDDYKIITKFLTKSSNQSLTKVYNLHHFLEK